MHAGMLLTREEEYQGRIMEIGISVLCKVELFLSDFFHTPTLTYSYHKDL